MELAATMYAVVAVSLNYGKIWSHLPSGERGTFELFLCLLLLLLESGGRPAWVRRTLTGFFARAARLHVLHRAGRRHVARGVAVDSLERWQATDLHYV